MWFKIVHIPFLRVNGMALFPFILLRQKQDTTGAILINHEKIHLKQQLELLIFPFYLLYFINYSLNLLVYRNHNKAYKNICFEREAYRMEADFNYLKRRKFWAWIKFL